MITTVTKLENPHEEPDFAKLNGITPFLKKVVAEVNEMQEARSRSHEERLDQFDQTAKEFAQHRAQTDIRQKENANLHLESGRRQQALEDDLMKLQLLREEDNKKLSAFEEVCCNLREVLSSLSEECQGKDDESQNDGIQLHALLAHARCVRGQRDDKHLEAELERLRCATEIETSALREQFRKLEGENGSVRRELEQISSDFFKSDQAILEQLRCASELETSALREQQWKFEKDVTGLRRELDQISKDERQSRVDLTRALEAELSSRQSGTMEVREREQRIIADIHTLNMRIAELETDFNSTLSREVSGLTFRLDAFRNDVDTTRREVDTMHSSIREIGRPRLGEVPSDAFELRSVVHDLAEASRWQGEKLEEVLKRLGVKREGLNAGAGHSGSALVARLRTKRSASFGADVASSAYVSRESSFPGLSLFDSAPEGSSATPATSSQTSTLLNSGSPASPGTCSQASTLLNSGQTDYARIFEDTRLGSSPSNGSLGFDESRSRCSSRRNSDVSFGDGLLGSAAHLDSWTNRHFTTTSFAFAPPARSVTSTPRGFGSMKSADSPILILAKGNSPGNG